MAASPSRYTTVAIVLHWLIAAAIVFQILLGWRMEDSKGPTGFAVFQMHKSIGISILLLSLLRLAWRLTHKAPPLPAAMPRWEKLAAKVNHWAFYVIMIGLPLTGWGIVSTSKTGIPTLLFSAVPWPHLPILPGLAPALKQAWHEVFETGHGLLVWLTYVLLVMHVGAALKHQFINKDTVLGAMLPGSRPGFWFEPRLWAAAVGGVLVIAAAFAYPFGGVPARATAPAPAAEAKAALTPTAPAAAVTPLATDAPVVAAPVGTEAAKPSPWIVTKGSTLGFAADWGGTPINGTFRTWDADILFSPEALDASRIRVTVDVASATTGDAQNDASLPTADWFDASAHPKAVFTANRFRKTGENRYLVSGTLQLRGVSAPFSLPFTLTIAGDKATAIAAGALDRTKFGVGRGEWASTDQIGGVVKLKVALTATRKAGA